MTTRNVHIYPSPMTSESRLMRMASTAQASGVFSCSEVVGAASLGLPRREHVRPGITIERLGAATRTRSARIIAKILWHPLVIGHYLCRNVSAVQAHSVWCLPAAYAISRLHRAALIYNAHELETETPSMHGTKRLVAQVVERTLVRRCAFITVVNEPIADWYRSTYPGLQPLVLRNIPISTRSRATLDLRKSIGADALDVVIIHTGRLTHGRHILEMLESFSTPSLLSHHLVFLGDGPLRSEVLTASERAPNIHWIAPIAHDEVTAVVAQADAALCLIETKALSYRLSTPNKFFEALSAGIPVLCSDLPGVRAVLGAKAERWILPDPTVDTIRRRVREIRGSSRDTFLSPRTTLPSWSSESAPYATRLQAATGGRA